MNRMCIRNIQIILWVFFSSFTTTIDAAPIKCWTNKEGIKECGNKIPPEYSQGASVKVSQSGIVIGESKAAKSLEVIKKEKDALTKAEKSRKADEVLLKTFSSVEDLILARNNKTNQIDKEIFLLESRIKKLDENLQKVKAPLDANDSGVSPHLNNLNENANKILSQITESKQFIKTKEIEKNNISSQFRRDISRFRELLKPKN